MAIPAEVMIGIQNLPEIIKLAEGLYESYNNGTLTQEQFNTSWAAMQGLVNAAEAKWAAAGATE